MTLIPNVKGKSCCTISVEVAAKFGDFIVETRSYRQRSRRASADLDGPTSTCNLPLPLSSALISYGPDLVDQYRRAAGDVDRILEGEKPADLPVQQSTKVGLMINRKTAKALGINVPPTPLARTDAVSA